MFRYTEKKLASEITKAARAIDPQSHTEYKAELRQVKVFRSINPDSPAKIFLGNLFLKVKGLSRRDRMQVITNTLSDILSENDISPEELMDSMALRVRTPFEMHIRERFMSVQVGDIPKPVTYGSDQKIFLELVADNEDTVANIDHDQLKEAKVTADEAFRIASTRIIRSTDENQWSEVHDSVWMSSYQDDYDFSRLLVAGEDLRLPFESRPIIFAPSHSICLVTSTNDPNALQAMIDLGYELSGDHRPFSSLLWTLVNGVWTELSLSESDPLHSIIRLQRIHETISSYEDQKAYLNQLLESRNEDSYVAEFQVYENDDGYRSMCTYVLNLPSYLPKADTVAIVDPNAPEDDSVLGIIPWNEFEQALGQETLAMMKKETPPRFHLTGQIDAQQEENLRLSVSAEK